MKSNPFIVFLSAVLMTACSNTPDISLALHACAPLPAGGRASACACVLDGKAYVFGGRNADGIYLNDLWQYDPQTDSWTHLGATPLSPRVKAVTIAYKGAIYIGLGSGQEDVYSSDCYLRDWWQWTLGTNQWKQLAQYTSQRTISPVTYQVGERIYTIYGTDGCFSRDITYYDIPADSWHTEPEDWHRAKSVFGGVGADIQNRCFFGLGNNTSNLNQWYEADLPTDTWTKRCSLPGKGRALCACCSTENYIYVFGGRYFAGELTGGEVFADILRYDPQTDCWTRGGAMPCGPAENQIAFTLNGKAYFGLGENEKGEVLNCLYSIEY